MCIPNADNLFQISYTKWEFIARNVHTFQWNVREPGSRGSRLFLCLELHNFDRTFMQQILEELSQPSVRIHKD